MAGVLSAGTPMPLSLLQPCLLLLLVLLFAGKANAFGAGNIASVSKIEGQNWRHGDIEDTLLTLLISRAAGGKKFSKMDVKRVYFGNWLRDYSQAIDVGTVKYVSAEAIRLILWVLGFMSFGYGSNEFFVSAERLGCYRPEDHIDNPKDYADNIDARQYDRRLRGPVNERVELAIDPRTGMKNYIANEHAGCMTSAQHVRRLFSESIRLGRSYARSKNKEELYEALRLLGTGLHCLEDFSAHSNYTELALIEMGERDIFPHVGSRTGLQLEGARRAVFPLVTGTFGGVDFLHSMMGEFTDKATQSEIQQLEGTMQNGQRNDDSVLKDLLSKIPSGLIGSDDEAKKADELKANATRAQMNQMRVSPREPEAFTQQMQQISKDIYPIIEWHDNLMKSISEAIEKVPLLPDLLEQFEEQLNRYVFSLIAPFVLPIINQVKNELNTGSSEVIQSSKDKQLIVFNEHDCSDPTHSMLSKDHFSNVLNEPAGKVASAVLKWVVPQLIACWDDERMDVDRTLNRVISGTFHHPAQRDYGQDGASDGRRAMFTVVEQWWRGQDGREQDMLRRQLSRDGVYRGENHKEGVHDTGHGCGKPLGMTKNSAMIKDRMGGGGGGGALLADAGVNALASGLGDAIGGSSSGGGRDKNQELGKKVIGGLVGALGGGSLLSGLTGKKDDDDDDRRKYKHEEKEKKKKDKYDDDNSDDDRYKEKKKKKDKKHKGGKDSGSDSDDGHKTSTYRQEGYTQDGGYQRETVKYSAQGGHYQQSEYQETEYPGGTRVQETRRFEQDDSGERGHGYVSRVEERPTYGGNYERREEHREYGGGGSSEHRQQQTSTSSYQQQESYQSSSGMGRREEYGGSSGYGEQQSYGSGGGSGREGYGSSAYSGGQQSSGREGYGSSEGYGRTEYSSGQQDYGRREGYGEQPSYGQSGGGGGSYGGRGGYGEQQQRYDQGGENYGGSRGYGEQQQQQQQQGYGQSGGGYGEEREERDSYGGSGGYGSQGDNQEEGEGYGYRREY